MRRQDAIAAMINAQSKPTVKVDSAPGVPSTRGYCGTLGQESLSRVRDRQVASANHPVEARQESQYDNEKRLYGQEWANVWRDQRTAKTRDERIAAEAARVKAAHREADERERKQREADAKCLAEQQQRATQVIFDNQSKAEVRQLLASESPETVDKVIRLANGSTLVFVWASYLDQIHKEEHEAKKD